MIPCSECEGEGDIYTSRYGGNDPDVWRVGICEACSGEGHQICERRGCTIEASVFNEDGEALCNDCMAEWMADYDS